MTSSLTGGFIAPLSPCEKRGNTGPATQKASEIMLTAIHRRRRLPADAARRIRFLLRPPREPCRALRQSPSSGPAASARVLRARPLLSDPHRYPSAAD